MRAGLRDSEAEQRILHLRRDQRTALAVRKPVDRANIGALAQPEADDMRRMFFRLGAQPRIIGAVERDVRGEPKSVLLGQSVSVRVDIGGRRFIKTKPNEDKPT